MTGQEIKKIVKEAYLKEIIAEFKTPDNHSYLYGTKTYIMLDLADGEIWAHVDHAHEIVNYHSDTIITLCYQKQVSIPKVTQANVKKLMEKALELYWLKKYDEREVQNYCRNHAQEIIS